jgi:hypothetical protein
VGGPRIYIWRLVAVRGEGAMVVANKGFCVQSWVLSVMDICSVQARTIELFVDYLSKCDWEVWMGGWVDVVQPVKLFGHSMGQRQY